ncbi:putative snf2 family helicase atpase protein [Neofusicoccum parvum UCRNP2]|uniref:DNA helicase n=1 Tax=Botryosphaeria parva (strain UCR-NP2) TaxID=1287680 RepID=R1GF28_BOTPV|nr:putative snf2 family helicase atpase protein [Neofusicoccum parvum UCRNP2]
MKLADITDFFMKRKVERMASVYPRTPIAILHRAICAKKGNFDDALSYVCELEEAEQAKQQAQQAKQQAQQAKSMVDLTGDDDTSPVKPSKPSANRTTKPTSSLAAKRSSANQAVNVQTKSIAEKWSSLPLVHEISDDSSTQDQTPAKPRRRLVQGRKPAAASRSPDPSSPQKSAPAARQKKPVTIESDDEESEAEVTDEEVDEEAAQELADDLLSYINQCSAQDLADLSEKPVEDCEGILTKRPFKSLDAVRGVDLTPAPLTKGGKPRKNHRTTGDKVLDMAENMWAGYTSIDSLVYQIDELGKPIFSDMKRLGFGVKSSGAKSTGELNLLSMEDGKNDSGIGTPSSSAHDDEGDEDDAPRNNVQLLQKPSIMSKDLVLKDYQVIGLNWMNVLWRRRISGILADDMGLGKTCQVIAFLSHLYEMGHKGPHLVVVPGSTLENWLREFATFSPKLKAVPYYAEDKEKIYERAKILDNIKNINVIITPYDHCIKEKNGDNKFFRKLKPTVCVFDEGHMLRNSSSIRYQSLMRIPAELRLLLTGTPLQNNLQELMSILAFLMPKMFEGHEENLQYIFRKKAKTNEDSHAALLSAQRINRARSMMAPFVLRRKKQQVLGKHLPKKTCRVEYCDMVPKQKEIYDLLLARQLQVLMDRAAGIPNSDNANVTTDLRSAAVHPMLSRNFFHDDMIDQMASDFIKAYPNENRLRSKEAVFERLYWFSDIQICADIERYPRAYEKYQVPDELWFDSGKIHKMIELVQGWSENGDRALIFSQWTRTLDIMEQVFSCRDIKYLRIDGSTPTKDRQDLIDYFYKNEDIPVFMLSTKTGGTGINLTAANKVLIFDEMYNPQEDVQAENRAHRVGQTRDVEVVRLITKDTIEEKIHALGESKLAMDERVAGSGGLGDENDKKAEQAGVRQLEQMMLEDLKAAGKLSSADKATSGDVKEEFKGMMEKAGVNLAE